MSAPAAIACSKLMFPETQNSMTKGSLNVQIDDTSVNMFDAISNGAIAGGQSALNVAIVLIAFISLIGFVNLIIQSTFSIFGLNVTFDMILSYLFSPMSLFLGISDWEECLKLGELLGKKTVINEFVAYQSLGKMIKNGEISKRLEIIATYALVS
jgi:concentrative nucleoside transporter, CNT family